ncbi:hypothetical protein IAQ61_008712, partial [Plenodomus lingam]|uniref:uncharacterized protein n=1 Tax=Leptosphaeria maculans TaxID=5022 RepID=UPI003317B65B
ARSPRSGSTVYKTARQPRRHYTTCLNEDKMSALFLVSLNRASACGVYSFQFRAEEPCLIQKRGCSRRGYDIHTFRSFNAMARVNEQRSLIDDEARLGYRGNL